MRKKTTSTKATAVKTETAKKAAPAKETTKKELKSLFNNVPKEKRF